MYAASHAPATLAAEAAGSCQLLCGVALHGAYYLRLSLVTLKCHILMYGSTLYHIIP